MTPPPPPPFSRSVVRQLEFAGALTAAAVRATATTAAAALAALKAPSVSAPVRPVAAAAAADPDAEAGRMLPNDAPASRLPSLPSSPASEAGPIAAPPSDAVAPPLAAVVSSSIRSLHPAVEPKLPLRLSLLL